ncbi:MAG: hypothetical protein E7513_04175 [Ruminococcaceae bacterium]|nr:hypothetical protein [Oscillospiraceae bacterium]
MDTYTPYVYTALWLILSIYMFYIALKNSKFFFVLSGFFLFLSGWYLADELLTDINLFEGTYVWIYRSVAIVVLIACAFAYLKYRKSVANQENNTQDE